MELHIIALRSSATCLFYRHF